MMAMASLSPTVLLIPAVCLVTLVIRCLLLIPPAPFISHLLLVGVVVIMHPGSRVLPLRLALMVVCDAIDIVYNRLNQQKSEMAYTNQCCTHPSAAAA